MGHLFCTQNAKYNKQKGQEGGKKEIIKIISINVRGLRNKTKRLRIFNWIKEKHVDIVYRVTDYTFTSGCTEYVSVSNK